MRCGHKAHEELTISLGRGIQPTAQAVGFGSVALPQATNNYIILHFLISTLIISQEYSHDHLYPRFGLHGSHVL